MLGHAFAQTPGALQPIQAAHFGRTVRVRPLVVMQAERGALRKYQCPLPSFRFRNCNCQAR